MILKEMVCYLFVGSKENNIFCCPLIFAYAYTKWNLTSVHSWNFFFFRKYNISFLNGYYRPDGTDDHPFICSMERENGMLRCSDVPRRRVGRTSCLLDAGEALPEMGLRVDEPGSCVNWYQYYNECRAGELNPHKGAINFDNIGYAWIAIFQVNVCRINRRNLIGYHEVHTTYRCCWLCACFHSGNYSWGLGRHHVLCHGRTFFLQLHLLHFPHYSEYMLIAQMPTHASIYIKNYTYCMWCVLSSLGGLLLHDQPVPGRNSNAVFWNETERTRLNEIRAARTPAPSVGLHAGQR